MSAAVAALFVVGVAGAWTRPTTGPLPATAPRVESPVPVTVPAEPLAAVVPSAAAPASDAAPAQPVAAPTSAAEAAMAPPPAVFDGPVAPPAPPPPALVAPARQLATGAPSTGTWGVVVGINDYPGQGSDLRAAVNDATDVDLALAGMGVPAENRLVLLDGQATAGRIREAIDWLASRAAADATVVFFYGGHVRKLGPVTEAIVAADGALITDRELAERLSQVRASRAWIAMASCFGGGFTEVLGPGRILTGAAPADALAYETTQYARSFLVQYMVREAMIEKRAATSVQAAFTYAVTELARRHPTRLPVQIDLAGAPLDLHMILAAATSPLPAPGGMPTPPTTAPCRRVLLILSCR